MEISIEFAVGFGSTGRRFGVSFSRAQSEDLEGQVATIAEEGATCGKDRGEEFVHELILVTWRNAVLRGRSNARAGR
jgi:hypothetical protein